MKFESHKPCEQLAPYVREFVISEQAQAAEYRILPDTAMVLGFQYKGRLSKLSGGGEAPLSAAGITGLADSCSIFKNEAGTGTVLVFFRETGASAFFGPGIHELFRESVPLDNFMLRSELMVLEERLCEAGSDALRIKAIERFLLSRLKPAAADQLVHSALAYIYKSGGTIRMKELVNSLNISQSAFEKRFRKAVGASPKKFASIVRFRKIIQNHDPAGSLTGLGYESGFYDQAHFIKEFKAFTGEAPETFFRPE